MILGRRRSLAGVINGAARSSAPSTAWRARRQRRCWKECVMALKVPRGLDDRSTPSGDPEDLTRLQNGASITRFPVQYNKAISARNAFAHESGIHQDGMLKIARPTRS